MSLFFPEDTGDLYDYFPGEFVYGDDYYVDDYYMREKWWYVSDDPSYMISNKGRVWSSKTQQFIKPKPMDNHGHLGVCLYSNGRRKYRYIHRLQAEAFLENHTGLPNVLHGDDDPTNNDIDNLRWGTQKENAQDCFMNGHAYYPTDEDREKGFAKTRIPVLATNLETGESIRFRGQSEASRELGIQQANIWKVLNGQRSQTCGYYFEYLPKD